MANKTFYTKPEVDKLISDVREELLKEIEAWKASMVTTTETTSEEGDLND